MDSATTSAATVPAIIGLVELVKKAGLPEQCAPLAALAFGILASVAGIYGPHHDLLSLIQSGLALSAAAVGVHATGRVVGKAVQRRQRAPNPTHHKPLRHN